MRGKRVVVIGIVILLVVVIVVFSGGVIVFSGGVIVVVVAENDRFRAVDCFTRRSPRFSPRMSCWSDVGVGVEVHRIRCGGRSVIVIVGVVVESGLPRVMD